MVLVNKMMISVRRHYYGHEHDITDGTTHIVLFRNTHTQSDTAAFTTVHPTADTTTLGDTDCPETTVRNENEYELEDFSEKTGF